MRVELNKLAIVVAATSFLCWTGEGRAGQTVVANPNAPDLLAEKALNVGPQSAPPDVLVLTKIVAKPGTLRQVETLEAERAAALKRAGWPHTFVASEAITGPAQVWILTRHEKIAEIADDVAFIDKNPGLKSDLDRIDAAEGPLIESKINVSTKYQPEISYRPNFNWTQAKYWEIIWVHLRDGHHEAYLDNRKLTREEHELGGFDTHQMMYAVKTGEESGTFFVIRPMNTLGLLDELHAVDDGEPETPADAARKIKDFAESAQTEQEAYFRTLPDLTSIK